MMNLFQLWSGIVANTPLRSFRISDELYSAAKAQAEREGVSLTEAIVTWLEFYAAGGTCG